LRGFAAIGLLNPKRDTNVGGAMRAAYCYDASFIAVSGLRYRRQSSDVTATYRHIPLLQVEDLYDAIPHDCIPIGIELVPGATSLCTFSHPERAFYVFGPEDSGLGKKTLLWCKHAVYVPTRRCLNLAACVNVVLYDRMMKRGERYGDAIPSKESRE
jgi:tRNA(Leu) C34 or U34 (ribose-2'-O)-methylase TrmL